ncbi:hypothetical protein BDV06DRAFT_198921 [Aspergillus oleicola]
MRQARLSLTATCWPTIFAPSRAYAKNANDAALPVLRSGCGGASSDSHRATGLSFQVSALCSVKNLKFPSQQGVPHTWQFFPGMTQISLPDLWHLGHRTPGIVIVLLVVALLSGFIESMQRAFRMGPREDC